jgi:MFS family permease
VADWLQNWPLWKRDAILGILCFVAVIATVASPLLAADSTTLAILFGRTFQDAAELTAFHLLGVAAGGVIFVPSARVWGKRHLFLFGSLLMLASSAWGGATQIDYNYTSILWARIFQGVALAPFEGLVNACVGDLYFVHERGPRMAFTNTCLFGGAFLTPVFVGMIAHDNSLGWQWSFYFMAIFMAPGFLLLLLFVPETAYRRPKSLDLDYLADDTSGTSSPAEQSTEPRGSEEKPLHEMTITEAPPAKKTLVQRMMPFDGRKTDESFWLLFLRPFPLFFHPAILWACLMQGVIIGWTVMVGVILSVIFLGPPLFFNEKEAGNLYVGAFIGSVLGLVLSGLYSEFTTRLMIRLNKGKYEPEFRLLLTIPCTVFAAIGLYGFGITAADVARYGWLIPDVFIAFIIISMVMGAIASAQYILDAHRNLAVEAFTNLLIFKNVFSFVLAYKAYNWVFEGGIDSMFITFASIEMGICALTLPMYVFGKRNRAYFHKHDILKVCRLR